MNILKQTLLIAGFSALTFGCAPESDDPLDSELAESEQTLTASQLGSATRKTIASVIAAENSLFTSTGRLLITGDKGIYELSKVVTDAGTANYPLNRFYPANGCQFGGITETRGTVYVNCYTGADSYLYAAPVGTLAFQQIATLTGRGLANGLTSDPAGNLYIATTLQNQIIKLKVQQNPLQVSPLSLFLNGSGPLTNGIKYYAGYVYWSDGPAVKRVAVSNGEAVGSVEQTARYRPQFLFDTTAFDDLAVDGAGQLICDFTKNAVRQFDFANNQIGAAGGFNGPSSVQRALGRAGFSQGALIVTERSGNRVSVVE